MTNPEFQTLYNALQNITNMDITYDANAPTKQHRIDYWKFSDLAKLHPVQFNKAHAIDDISYSIVSHIPFTTVWAPEKLAKTTSEHMRRNADGDIELTRFGAWATTKKYPELFATQLFLVHPKAVFDSWLSAVYRFGRIYWRDQVGLIERRFRDAMATQPMSESAARRIMNMTLFDNLPPDTIKLMNDIPVKSTPDPLSNYMTMDLMRERASAMKTVLVWLSEPTTPQFLETGLHAVFSDARARIIKTTGRTPEENITRLNIAQVKHEYYKMQNNFRRKQISRHFR